MRTIRHWTPRYLWNRARQRLYSRRFPENPWLTSDAVEILNTMLKPVDVGLEWGAGRSTLWLASRLSHLISIEDNPQWYSFVCSSLAAKGQRNVIVKLCEASSAPEDSNKYNQYWRIVEEFGPCSLDVVLVDGKYRDICATSVLDKLSHGGLMVIDNCNRYLPSASRSPNSRRLHDGPATEQWKLFAESVASWRYIWTSNGVWDTGVWIKP